MTSLLPIFVAKSSEDSMIKLIFGAIVVAFWLGSALISAINKRVQENKRRARYGQMPQGFTRPAPPSARVAAGFSPPPVKAKSARRAKRQAIAPAPQPPVRPTFSTAVAPPISAAPPAPARAASKAAPPAQIARLLHRPESLRAALILNEILSPPLSIRDSVQDGRHVE
ncbi:MAG: hypothetical protein JWN40_1945 [Phycisphaerales bacterium]|nr:hypothetical protein [Phycisphaerales bacterium]